MTFQHNSQIQIHKQHNTNPVLVTYSPIASLIQGRYFVFVTRRAVPLHLQSLLYPPSFIILRLIVQKLSYRVDKQTNKEILLKTSTSFRRYAMAGKINQPCVSSA